MKTFIRASIGALAMIGAVSTYTVPAAAADTYDGNWLYDMCKQGPLPSGKTFKPTEETVAKLSCMAFTIGAFQAATATNTAFMSRCLPDEGITPIQITDIVRKFLADHPEQRHKQAAALVIGAAVLGFCPSLAQKWSDLQ